MRLTVELARVATGKTKQEVADSLGISLRKYEKIEADPSIATASQVRGISTFLGLSYEEIFFGKNSTESRTGVKKWQN